MNLQKNISIFIATVSELFSIHEVHYSSDNNYKCTIKTFNCTIPIEALSKLLELQPSVVTNLSNSSDGDYLVISANIVQ